MTERPDAELNPSPSEVLVAALAGEAEAVATGVFRLDPAEARAKLRAHQLDDPHAYVLLLVEVAALAVDPSHGDHGRIEFELGSISEARIQGLSLSDEELAAPFDAIFASLPEAGPARRRARALRLLGLAINAALAKGAKAVVLVSSDDEGRRRRAVIEEGAAHELASLAAAEPNETRFQFIGGVAELSRPRYERELLHSRCRFASTAVLIDDRAVNLGLRAALPEDAEVHPLAFADPSWGGFAAWLEGSGRAKVLVSTRGVLGETIVLEGCEPGFVAVVEVDLRKDLSQRKLVRDAEFEAFEARIRAAHERLPRPQPKASAATSEELPRAQLLLVLALVILPIPLGIALIVLRGDGPSPGSIDALEQRCRSEDAAACLEASERSTAEGEDARAFELARRGCELELAAACERVDALGETEH